MATLFKPDMQGLAAHKVAGNRRAVQLGANDWNCLFSRGHGQPSSPYQSLT
jgi:hypothetical protein